MMTPWERHQRKWSPCKRCDLCKRRRRVVLARGSIPCDVMVIGEAPGSSENVIGRPFCGPAGRLLDAMLQDSGMDRHRVCLTNVVACIPKEESGSKAGEPPDWACKACRPRLLEMVEMCRPRLIVTVGKVSDKWTPLAADGYGGEWLSILHPAFLLRMDVAQRGLAIQRVVVDLRDAAEEL